MSRVTQWLEKLGLGQYAAVFSENAIDLDVLPELSESDLESIGVLLGHRKMILQALATLPASAEAAEVQDADTPPARAVMEAERRLTRRLMAQWHKLRGNRRCPLVSDFLNWIPPELFSDCFNFVSSKNLDEGRLSLGSNVARISGITKTSLLLAEVPGNTLLGAAIRSLEDALKGQPIIESGEFEDGRSNRYLYRAILLPLEDDEGEIIQVICGAGCKARPIKA